MGSFSFCGPELPGKKSEKITVGGNFTEMEKEHQPFCHPLKHETYEQTKWNPQPGPAVYPDATAWSRRGTQLSLVILCPVNSQEMSRYESSKFGVICQSMMVNTNTWVPYPPLPLWLSMGLMAWNAWWGWSEDVLLFPPSLHCPALLLFLLYPRLRYSQALIQVCGY